MKIFVNILFLMTFFVFAVSAAQAKTSRASPFYEPPYLEGSRHIQIPQWAHEDWYAEDWMSQKNGMALIQGFYKADILRDQIATKKGMPILVVGPNFYRLSGYDKRRITHIVDVTYGMTKQKKNGSFYLKDWNTNVLIGVFDENGLRLH